MLHHAEWPAATQRVAHGLEFVDPGLVQVHRWRPDPSDSGLDRKVAVHGGVARKP
jgi:hypothetical protein